MLEVDYKDVLTEKFEAMRVKQPGLSLRQFAFAIGLTPPNLSDIFKGRCGLSTKNAVKVARGLGMDESEQKFFLDLVESRHARSRTDREAAVRRLSERSEHPLGAPATGEAVSSITKWYYIAALELISLTNGNIDSVDLSKRLSITNEEAAGALETLLKIGLIRKIGRRFIREKDQLRIEAPVHSDLIRKYHGQILDLGKDAIVEQTMLERKLSSTMMTSDSSRMEEVARFLDEMDNEFYRRFEAKTNGDSVRCFSYQFFRVDREVDTSREVDA